MEDAIAQVIEWATGILGQYGLAGVIIAGSLGWNIKQYLDNQGLHAAALTQSDAFRNELTALQDKRLGDYQALAPMLAENVESNKAVTRALQDGQRLTEAIALREAGRRRTA